MIIDIHTHILDKDIYKSYLLKAKKRIKKSFVLSFVDSDLKTLLKFISEEKNLHLIGGIDVNKNIPKQLEFFKDKKIVGLKLYPGYQHFYPSDKKIYSIAKFCEEYNIPLTFHSGDVWDTKGNAILKYSKSIYIDQLAVKFPNCKIVIAHFGFPHFLETANIVSKNKNVYTDISGTIDNDYSSSKEQKILFNQYLNDLRRVFAYFPDVKEKVMFGTDYAGEKTPLNEIELYISLVKKLFNKKEQDSVFYKLATKLFKI